MVVWDIIRVTFAYLIIIAITIIIQSITNFIMRKTNDFFNSKEFPFKRTTAMLVMLYIFIVSILIDILIWAIFIVVSGLIMSFDEAFTFATDSFTTLGTDEMLPSPWEYIGPVIAVNGIIIIAFGGSCLYNILYPTPESGP